ncbi:AraC family transcriptional regulator [Bradyrhizobium diazoefficiens]|uniref:helix-turn-helix transcriptional regulator n=1 Tax=Bradyrhizobium diazoefficiens TaxID=1355477 RepID=UPI00289FC7C9|nr:AraC family transcriptional regulator [Bradyrhizobium diazoefficiens]
MQPDVTFHLDMVFRSLPDATLASGICPAMDCLRTPDLIESNDLILTIALSGGCVLRVRGEEIPIGAGTAALTRTTDVSSCSIHSTSNLVNFRFPFDKMAPLITDLDAAVMRPIPVDHEAVRLLVHYASVLNDEDMLTTPEVQSLVSSHLQDLAALAIGATRDAAVLAGGRGVPAARLRAIKADIVKNLTDRQLSIEAVALRHGITPRYVSMLFDGDATTFSEFVLVQRLTRAHRMLVDPRLSDRTVSSVAFEAGFGDLSYFNRAFRGRYGATPSDVRRSAHRENGDS